MTKRGHPAAGHEGKALIGFPGSGADYKLTWQGLHGKYCLTGSVPVLIMITKLAYVVISEVGELGAGHL